MTDERPDRCPFGCPEQVGGRSLGSILGGDTLSHVHEVGPAQPSEHVMLLIGSRDAAEKTRILVAARAASSIGSPYIASLIDAGADTERVWLVFPRLAGNLESLIRDSSPLPVEHTLTVLRDIAAGLDTAHQAGLVHQNVKPSNLLLTYAGDVRHAVVTGFGTGRLHRVASEVSTSGTFPGTLNYVAPEQLDGTALSGATDQYALASVAVECLTGSPPYPLGHQGPVIAAHLAGQPPSVHDRRGDVPLAADDVIKRAMSRSPAQRFETCTAFVGALSIALLEHSTVTVAAAVTTLRAVGGPCAGVQFPLPLGRYLVGRSEDCDVAIADSFLSRQHFILAVTDSEVSVEDAGSSNGTLVDGEACRGIQRLEAGQLVEAGSSLFEVAGPQTETREFADQDPNACEVVDLSRDRGLGRGRRGLHDAGFLRMRVGFHSPSGRGQPAARPVPLTVELPRQAPLVVSGETSAVAGLIRWLILQAAVIRSPDDLAIAAVLRPTVDDVWAWVGTLPQAGMSHPPLDGSHVATDPSTATSLVERLISLGDRGLAVDGPALLAFVDPSLVPGRLVDRLVSLAGTNRLHLVLIEDTTLVANVGGGSRIRIHDSSVWVRDPGNMQSGTADAVSAHTATAVAVALS